MIKSSIVFEACCVPTKIVKHVGQNVGIYVTFDRFDGFDDPQKTEKNH